MILDHLQALAVLEQESKLAQSDPVEGEWPARVVRLSQLCANGAPKTHIAMLGTALLAKATNVDVDVFALKSGAGTRGAYSARSLAKDVLAANAPRLMIDLGVSGREPLNNQPYFRGVAIDDTLAAVVRPDARPAFDFLVTCLTELATLDARSARVALRAFIQVRRKRTIIYELPAGARGFLETSFVEAIRSFVQQSSEGGKRAQAVVAGVLDSAFLADRVLVSRVNDPDRRFPGDVALIAHGNSQRLERTYEVRDKNVTTQDIYSFAEKAAGFSVNRAGIVAVSARQPEIEIYSAIEFAQNLGVKIMLFRGWGPFVGEALFSSEHHPIAVIDAAATAILSRLGEIEVSEEAMTRWVDLVAGMRRMNSAPGLQY